MKVLSGILKESKEYYRSIHKELSNRIKLLPKGSIKKRSIYGKVYYYLQFRKGEKVIHKYLGKEKPSNIEKSLKKRRLMIDQLNQVKQALKILVRSERKRDAGTNKKSA